VNKKYDLSSKVYAQQKEPKLTNQHGIYSLVTTESYYC